MYTRNTYFYDTVCISKSRLTTLSLLQPRNSSGLPDITLCLEHISYAILSQLRTPFIINYSSSIIMCHKWDTYVSWECSYLTNLSYSSVPLGKVIVFSLFHKPQQNCVRSVDVSMRMTSIPDLEVRR